MAADYEYMGVHFRHGRNEHVFLLNATRHVEDVYLVLRATKWCEQNISWPKTQVIVEMDWYVNMGDIFIVDDDHAFAFRMRWC